MTHKEVINSIENILYHNCATMSEKIEQIAELVTLTRNRTVIDTMYLVRSKTITPSMPNMDIIKKLEEHEKEQNT